MKLEQVTLDELLGPKHAGTLGVNPRFVQLSPIKAAILQKLRSGGAMSSAELVNALGRRWSKSGVTGRLSELTAPSLRLVESREVPGLNVRMYAITNLGKRALRGEPLN